MVRTFLKPSFFSGCTLGVLLLVRSLYVPQSTCSCVTIIIVMHHGTGKEQN